MRGTFYRRPPSTLLSPLPGRGGGRWPPSALRWRSAPGAARPSRPGNFLPLAAGGRGLRCAGASTPSVRHRGHAGSRVSSSTVAFLYFCLPLPLSLSVSDSDSFSGSPHPLRVSLFLFHSLSPCFSWDVPVCLLFCLFRCLSVLPYFLFLFLPLAACLSLPLLSLLPGPPEHHQLPDPEAPCPGEHTPAHLLGTSRYRDLQVRRPP